jgi:hypothetical protein
LPYYQNYTPDEREAMKPYIAKRVDKPTDSLSREDWNDLTSWKVTSIVWTSLWPAPHRGRAGDDRVD